MTLPQGWKNQQKSNSSSSSTITIDDKINIHELIAKYNLAIDSKNIDEWTNTWADDGIWITTFGEAKGKTELKNMVNQITNEFASGKRHVSTNIVIEDISSSATNGMANAKSYLTVIEAHKTPEVVATGVYSDTLRKDGSGKWKFFQRQLDIDLVNE
ncbi:MAG TPA: nuclear transport factor 2 family protein [Nitrososphaeraceae archaeon]|nr:nuclear transport factor 2 family protein [Nitrososphaeraceae archaeon]